MTGGQETSTSHDASKCANIRQRVIKESTIDRFPSSMDVKIESSSPGGVTSGPQKCAGCGKNIADRYLLKALDMLWHEDCLKCGCCDCRLGEVGSTLYTKANLLLCRRDYLRLFGNTGHCAACSKVIPAFEMVMRARHNVYHLECFACQQCSHRFCVGDRFYLCDNKILCEYDYEERLVFANMASMTSSTSTSTTNGPSTTSLKRSTAPSSPQVHHIQNSGPASSAQPATTIHCNVIVNEDSPSAPLLQQQYHQQQTIIELGGRSK